MKIIYNITDPFIGNDFNITESFEELNENSNIQYAIDSWNKFKSELTDDKIISLLRKNKNGTLSKVQPKSIYTSLVGTLVTDFTNSYLAPHIRIVYIDNDTVKIITDTSYFSL